MHLFDIIIPRVSIKYRHFHSIHLQMGIVAVKFHLLLKEYFKNQESKLVGFQLKSS